MSAIGTLLKIGSLDRRTTIKTKTEMIETNGERDWSYSNLATVWSNINFGAVAEKGEDETDKGITLFDGIEITMRYRADFDETAIIEYDSKEYDIDSITELGRKRYLKIRAQNRV